MVKLIALILLVVIFLIMFITAICCLVTASHADDFWLGEKQYENDIN